MSRYLAKPPIDHAQRRHDRLELLEAALAVESRRKRGNGRGRDLFETRRPTVSRVR